MRVDGWMDGMCGGYVSGCGRCIYILDHAVDRPGSPDPKPPPHAGLHPCGMRRRRQEHPQARRDRPPRTTPAQRRWPSLGSRDPEIHFFSTKSKKWLKSKKLGP